MKSYVFNLNTYDMTGMPSDYDYQTAAALWLEVDDLNETFPRFTVTLAENASGSLILSVETDDEKSLPALFERYAIAREIERIADEYGGFELPSRFLFGERELNELRSAI